MQADSVHEDKPGFFSKIFGHHDPSQVNTGAGDPPPPPKPSSLVQPTTTLPDPAANTPTEADLSASPIVAPDDGVQSSTMSDVHAVPKGGHEPLDLKDGSDSTIASSTTPENIAPAVESTELVAKPVTLPSDEPVADGALQTLIETPDTPPDTKLTPEEDTESEVKPAEPVTEAASGDAPVESASAEPTKPEATATSSTPEPPAPPVEEGEVWRATHLDNPAESADTVESGEAASTPESTTPIIESESTELASAVHNDHEPSQQQPAAEVANEQSVPADDTLELAEITKKHASAPDQPAKTSASSEESAPKEVTPQVQAAVVRLEGQLDELEIGIQKIRAEIKNLQ